MSRELKGNFSYLVAHTRHMFVIFWGVLLGLLVVTLIMNYLIFKDGTIVYQLSFPLYAVSAVIGIQLVKNVIPYLIQMGSTRMGIFKSVGIYFLGISFFNAALASVVYTITTAVFGTNMGSQEEIIAFNHFADIIENTFLSRIVVDMSLMFFLFVSGFIVGLIFYKFGKVIGIISIALVIFTFIVGMAQGWLVNFFISIFTNIDLVFFMNMILISVVMYLISYILLRRLSIA